MPISMYQASIPVFIRGLTVISALLEKAEAHVAKFGLDQASFIESRLAPDMLPLTGQVQRASDTSKFSAARLSGEPAPPFADDEASFDELQARIAKTIAFLEAIEPASFDGAEAREVAIFRGEEERRLPGDAYLLTFALPNFYFHVVTAHDILRHKGVAVGKRDYLGPY